MGKPYENAAFKKASKAWLDGKKCAWCGSREKLATHHTKEPLSEKMLFHFLADDLLALKVHQGEYEYKPKPQYGWICSTEDYNKFMEKYTPKINAKVEEIRKKAIDYYYSFQDCVPLCGRCHASYSMKVRRMGFYLDLDNGLKELPPLSILKKELVKFHNSICGKDFEIDKLWWYVKKEFEETGKLESFTYCRHYCREYPGGVAVCPHLAHYMGE
jgi:hypothetical protein